MLWEPLHCCNLVRLEEQALVMSPSFRRRNWCTRRLGCDFKPTCDILYPDHYVQRFLQWGSPQIIWASSESSGWSPRPECHLALQGLWLHFRLWKALPPVRRESRACPEHAAGKACRLNGPSSRDADTSHTSVPSPYFYLTSCSKNWPAGHENYLQVEKAEDSEGLRTGFQDLFLVELWLRVSLTSCNSQKTLQLVMLFPPMSGRTGIFC